MSDLQPQSHAERPAPPLALPSEAFSLLFASRRARRLLYVFLAIDVAFISLHVLLAVAARAGLVPDVLPASLNFSSITEDFGLPEFWNVGKALLAAAILSMTWARTRQTVYLCWVLVFAVVGLDDAFRVHEQLGDALNRVFFERVMGKDGEFVGQLLVEGVYAIVFGVALLAAHAAAERRHAVYSLIILFFFAIVVFFAVVVDALHGFAIWVRPELRERDMFHGLFNVFEDGGELLSLSLALAVAIAVHGAATTPSLRPPLEPHSPRYDHSG